MIDVLVADDHREVRAALARLIAAAPDLRLVGIAADGQEAVDEAHRLRPDVVVMDLAMPVLDGLEATRRILAAHPGTKVVVLTADARRDHVVRAFAVGAVGYLVKDGDTDELLAAVRRAVLGHATLDLRVSDAFVRDPVD